MSWFYAKHGKQEGPIEEAVLRSKVTSGELNPDDLVWREGMPEWTPAGKVPELLPGAVAEASASPEPPSAAGEGPAPAAPPASSVPQGGATAQVTPPGGAAMQAQPSAGMPMIATPPPTSGLAIASMVCGIISLLACYVWAVVGIPAVICGHLALKAINSSAHPVEGKGMAIAGLITGYLAILIQIVAIILVVIFVSSAA